MSIAHAQTITPNESSIVLQSPKKIGINLNGPTYYQGGEIYKNLLWRNPGFEPDLYRDKFVAFKAGTTTTFPSPNTYDPVIANFWMGATFRIYRGTARTVACSGTVASNTTAKNNAGPVYTFSQPCSSAVQEGDVIILRQAIACTTEAVWEGQGGGWWGNVSNGGKLLSECSAPYDGTQSLRLDATVSGSTAGVKGYVDTNPSDVGILLNGTYTISGFYKTIGSATLSVDARRLVTSAAGSPFLCAGKTFAASSAWTSFTVTCPATETNQVAAGPVDVDFEAQSGAVLLDNVSFQKTSGVDPTNTTVFRDELLNTLKAHCAGASLSGVPCELRDWAGENAEEIDNSIKPMFERSPSLPGASYDYPPNGGTGSLSVGLEEFLQLCKAINAEPYYTLPETTGPEDGGKWIEYLNGAVSTPYGAKRAANGQTASWLSVFPTIHLPMGNENWNEGATGQGLGYRVDAPDYYYDYSVDAAGVWATMRGSASWPAGGTGIDLVLGFQDGNANYGVTEAMARANPNSAELAPYTQAYIGDVTPVTSLWNPLFYEVVANTTNPDTTFYQQGTAIKSHGKLNVYEFDNGTSQGSSALTQSVLDSFTDAAGYGTATALQALQHLTFGIVDQNFFSLDQYAFYIPAVGWVHNWGAVIDMGGATNAVRPQELGMRMANAAIIGPMYSCPVANPTTYNLLANHNGADSSGEPATNNVPQQFSYCFKSGTQRSMIVINTDVAGSHAIGFAGPQMPSGQVILTRYAPSSISATNEATANNPTNTAAQNVSINAPFTVANPSGDTLPPYSITRYDWTASTNTVSPTASNATLTVSDTAPLTGVPVVLTSTVAPSAATGTVTFQDFGAAFATAPLIGGSAIYTVASLTAGSHTITAVYAGNSTYAASTSAPLAMMVGDLPALPTNRKPTSTTLSFPSSNPAGNSSFTIVASTDSTSVTGTIKFFDGPTSLGTAKLSRGNAVYTVNSIAPGTHLYSAAYLGTSLYSASTSPVSVVTAATIPTTLQLTSSSTAPAVGSSILLKASVVSSAASGTVSFLDGSAIIGTANLVSGTANFTLPAIASGTHSFTASYAGNSTYSPSQSTAILVMPHAAIPYLHTNFDEHPAGTALNKTLPATNIVSGVWSDPNGDWTYIAGGGIVSDTSDLSNPVFIDAAHSDYTATYVLPANGVHLLFRYTDLKHMLFVVTYAGEVDLYSTIGNSTKTLATIYPSSTVGTVTVSLLGQTAILSCGGQTATATIPANLPVSTKMGFFPTSSKYVITSLDVSP
ncbi:Ig-like domain repeat protein [Granulicella tundricola]|uniref:Ig-like domain repeat protein n=1 Tax=Granulicella tundricola TaxID=940615 RepID=UPI0018DD0D4E|nr:Ig-like domain repeat protein [Granulicella tundricola]